MSESVIEALPGGLMDVAAAADLIKKGEFLVVAGDAELLAKLPKGNWIGGTIPYFMGPRGGECSRKQVFVTRVGGPAEAPTIKIYDVTNLDQICLDAPDNGYSLIILPAFSAVHAHYARNAPGFEDMFVKPVIGWVSGVHLDHLADAVPQVFDGSRGEAETDAAVVMHVPLPPTCYAQVDIINGMQQGSGPTIRFPSTGFSATTAKIDGVDQNFAEYLVKNRVDTKLPLVADYCGAMINVSIKGVDEKEGRVDFYAPVFADSEYRVAEGTLPAFSQGDGAGTTFSCNCILNYLYGELEGKRTADFTGPMTFGEIAYLLLNQTLVHMRIVRS
ncbi:DUF6976 family protein [Nitrogeniibacter mangrovi]|nr:hypothetical protein [Nitrogeniibacter mangrovi]